MLNIILIIIIIIIIIINNNNNIIVSGVNKSVTNVKHHIIEED